MEADSLGMQAAEQTRAGPKEDSPDAGVSSNGGARPHKLKKTKRVRPRLQGDSAVSTTVCSPGKAPVAKRLRSTPQSAKKPVTSAEGNAPPTVVAVPIRAKKPKKDTKIKPDYASVVSAEVPQRVTPVDADATSPAVAQKKRVRKARAAARAAAAAEAAAAEAEQAAAEKKQQKAAKQQIRSARERDSKILKVRIAQLIHVHRRALPHTMP